MRQGQILRNRMFAFNSRVTESVYKHWWKLREKIQSCLIRQNWTHYDAMSKDSNALFQERSDYILGKNNKGQRCKTRSMANVKCFENNFQTLKNMYKQQISALQISYELILREKLKLLDSIKDQAEFESNLNMMLQFNSDAAENNKMHLNEVQYSAHKRDQCYKQYLEIHQSIKLDKPKVLPQTSPIKEHGSPLRKPIGKLSKLPEFRTYSEIKRKELEMRKQQKNSENITSKVDSTVSAKLIPTIEKTTDDSLTPRKRGRPRKYSPIVQSSTNDTQVSSPKSNPFIISSENTSIQIPVYETEHQLLHQLEENLAIDDSLETQENIFKFNSPVRKIQQSTLDSSDRKGDSLLDSKDHFLSGLQSVRESLQEIQKQSISEERVAEGSQVKKISHVLISNETKKRAPVGKCEKRNPCQQLQIIKKVQKPNEASNTKTQIPLEQCINASSKVKQEHGLQPTQKIATNITENLKNLAASVNRLISQSNDDPEIIVIEDDSAENTNPQVIPKRPNFQPQRFIKYQHLKMPMQNLPLHFPQYIPYPLQNCYEIPVGAYYPHLPQYMLANTNQASSPMLQFPQQKMSFGKQLKQIINNTSIPQEAPSLPSKRKASPLQVRVEKPKIIQIDQIKEVSIPQVPIQPYNQNQSPYFQKLQESKSSSQTGDIDPQTLQSTSADSSGNAQSPILTDLKDKEQEFECEFGEIEKKSDPHNLRHLIGVNTEENTCIQTSDPRKRAIKYQYKQQQTFLKENSSSLFKQVTSRNQQFSNLLDKSKPKYLVQRQLNLQTGRVISAGH
ncbi:hypothetical protein FGO68_gene4277 [Halteria grandinella]|uniref:Uncharacterized protein n=1 Tax=Halteria grandinella TaxID=5974 RepID=A0A8J8P105_HALGN|nr:hypothetical protein FGO68_gene4277 [Halteria grandinella]